MWFSAEGTALDTTTPEDTPFDGDFVTQFSGRDCSNSVLKLRVPGAESKHRHADFRSSRGS
jgi:hypothetical protein